MNILMVGSGKGSWQIRGQQLGATMGARVLSEPSDEDIKWADVVVLVKRAGLKFARRVHQLDRPLVWDALDCWQQPTMHRFTEKQANDWLKAQIAAIRPDLTIGATEAMARAANGVYLPHHGWAGLAPTPARERVEVVAYQGNPTYLGKWAGAIAAACEKRGWQFVINPVDLGTADILVAFRDGQWDGWICRQWKSGVKLVNAICAGRPILMQMYQAGKDLQPYGTVLDDASEMNESLEIWARHAVRQAVADDSLRRAHYFQVAAIADRYQHILSDVCQHIVRYEEPSCAH